ncbi:hypothetical protein [Mesoterricola silvestris]|uniref:Uncharacterized protein n=1 Tax=Mesoterricola silvestris TaxID=2927979 RepID=A0AA48GNF4_9BACT|nr:hypothetical protein [Mesoterricola silvestris]BDU74544.1 hypothetical protein METEAL_37180 [Mesoterricola silvestris]
MPSKKSEDWIHANHSSREWQVQAVDGKVVITRIPEEPQKTPTRKDDLPFKIKPRKIWGFSMVMPAPPPPPDASPEERAKIEEATNKMKPTYHRTYSQRFIGRRVVAKAPDGWIVGFDAGEWGGGLYWFSSDGKKHYQIALPRPVGWLDAENVRDILPDGGSFLVAQGLAHMSLDRGKVIRVSREAKGKWKAELVADLGSAPCLCLKDGDDSWIIFTMEAMLRLRRKGPMETLGQFEFAGWLYPNSIARAGDGAIYVGMRHFVARVLPDGDRYEVELLVPNDLPLFDPETLRVDAEFPHPDFDDWKPWKAKMEWAVEEDGFSYLRNILWKDGANQVWQVRWEQERVKVIAPDGTSKEALAPFITSQAHYVDKDQILHRQSSGWECHGILVGTGRNGIPLNYFLVVVVDPQSRSWELLYGRTTWDGCPDLVIKPGSVTVEWQDDVPKRELRMESKWTVSRKEGGVTLQKDTPMYRLQHGYPAWFMFTADDASPNPDEAEHLGLLSVCWDIWKTDMQGGIARSNKAAIPKDPGNQVWRKGSGPDTWFPEPGEVRFRWEKEVEVRRLGMPLRTVSPEEASKMARDGSWRLFLTRDHDGQFLGDKIIEVN